jgi:hypothetical protein
MTSRVTDFWTYDHIKVTPINDLVFKRPVALLYLKLFVYYTVCQQCNKLYLSTQYVSALNDHLQVSYYAKTATLY